MNTQKPKQDFEAIYTQAHGSGMAAALALTPHPMIVTTQFGSSPQKSWFVEDGACGFAWVDFPGNTPFGRWAKKNGKARSQYPKGLCVWVSEFNQSMQKKEAYARAFAQVLRSHSIDCHIGSRMD